MEERHGYLQVKNRNAVVSSYQTYVPDQRNSHDEDTCRICLRTREEENTALRRRVDSINYEEVESIFESMGVGVGSGQASSELDDTEDYVLNACNGIQDIIVTGSVCIPFPIGHPFRHSNFAWPHFQTDPHHGQAWSHYMFYGRVRTWDGLIVILRIPVSVHLLAFSTPFVFLLFANDLLTLDQPQHFSLSHAGRWVFHGYLVGDQNFVGNWRKMELDVGIPSWEGPFIMSRREG
jgi:hypothetical protein